MKNHNRLSRSSCLFVSVCRSLSRPLFLHSSLSDNHVVLGESGYVLLRTQVLCLWSPALSVSQRVTGVRLVCKTCKSLVVVPTLAVVLSLTFWVLLGISVLSLICSSLAQMNPKKMAIFLFRERVKFALPGGKFKNDNSFYLFAAFEGTISKYLCLQMIENKILHILSLCSFLSVSIPQISNLMVWISRLEVPNFLSKNGRLFWRRLGRPWINLGHDLWRRGRRWNVSDFWFVPGSQPV